MGALDLKKRIAQLVTEYGIDIPVNPAFQEVDYETHKVITPGYSPTKFMQGIRENLRIKEILHKLFSEVPHKEGIVCNILSFIDSKESFDAIQFEIWLAASGEQKDLLTRKISDAINQDSVHQLSRNYKAEKEYAAVKGVSVLAYNTSGDKRAVKKAADALNLEDTQEFIKKQERKNLETAVSGVTLLVGYSQDINARKFAFELSKRYSDPELLQQVFFGLREFLIRKHKNIENYLGTIDPYVQDITKKYKDQGIKNDLLSLVSMMIAVIPDNKYIQEIMQELMKKTEYGLFLSSSSLHACNVHLRTAKNPREAKELINYCLRRKGKTSKRLAGEF
ncbi:MAG TPA: hypothetical protein VJJ75_02325 [Candidatus Nanoarchaeia archaeon]|nr:hypothetical protein [Candidatus Nanoarchaeia archaeon]